MSANYDYINRWTAEHAKRVTLKLNTDTDRDIIEWLEAQESKNGAVKAAIRDKIKKASL